MIKKKIAALAVALLATLGIGAVAAAPAYASDCAGNSVVCFWVDEYAGGSMYAEYQLTIGYCYPVPGWFNDQMTSVWNKANGPVQYFADAYCSGSWDIVPDGTYYSNVGSGMNDKMSSFRRTQF